MYLIYKDTANIQIYFRYLHVRASRKKNEL